MPGTLVAISLNGPPFLCPGLRSKVSIWLGPPFIHNRMHDRLRCGRGAAASASRPNQPDSEEPTTPAAVSRSQSRRARTGADMEGLQWSVSMVEHELRRVEQGPEQVGQRLAGGGTRRLVVLAAGAILGVGQELHGAIDLLARRLARQGGEVERLDALGRG